MLFFVSKIFWWIARPSVLLIVILGIGTLWSLARPRHRWARGLAATAALVLLAIILLPIDSWLLRPLENRFPQVETRPEHVDGVIVLGGAVDPDLTAIHGIPSLNDAAERFTTFVLLARLYPDAKLVFAGGSPSIFPGAPREADTAKILLGDLGLDTSRIVFDRDSRDTWENVANSKRLVDPKPGETWLVVTSAFHMPRSVGIFRRQGWPVVPWPVAFKAGVEEPLSTPGLRLQRLDTALHEWVGLVAYWLDGRTSALFPGP